MGRGGYHPGHPPPMSPGAGSYYRGYGGAHYGGGGNVYHGTAGSVYQGYGSRRGSMQSLVAASGTCLVSLVHSLCLR